MGRKCENCRYELKDSAKFCPNCGKKVEVKKTVVEKSESTKEQIAEKKRVNHIVVKIIIGVLVTSIVGAGAYMGYSKEKGQITNITMEENGTEANIETNTDEPEIVEDEIFDLSEEQIDSIRFASMLFDQTERKTSSDGGREDYTLNLKKNKIPRVILNGVTPGIVCVLDGSGTEVEGESVNTREEVLTVEQCKELLEGTFGYKVKNKDEVKNIYQQYGKDTFTFSYFEVGKSNTIYDTVRYVQTGKDEYHFYTEVAPWDGTRNTYVVSGIMDITAHKSKESRIGKFVFDKIDYKTISSEITSQDVQQVISAMFRSVMEKDDTRDISNPKGTFDVNQMTNEEFINYANRIITRVESVGEGKEKQETAQGVDDGMLIRKDEYENICKNSLGRSEVYDVEAVNQVNDGMVRFFGRDFDAWYDIWDAQLLQDIDGNITITGTLRNCIPDDRLRYSYKATGHADDNSELGMVIDKMEVMDYQKDDTTFSTQRLKQIQRRLGIPDSVNALSSVCLDDDYMSGLGKVLHVEYKVNDNTVGEADIDVVTGELEKNIIPYNVMFYEQNE